MPKRRLAVESLEQRLCMAAPVLQAAINLPSTGAWTPTPYRASPIMVDIFGTGKDDLISPAVGSKLVAYQTQSDGSLTPVVTYQAPNAIADIKSTPIVVTNPQTGEKDLFAAMGRDESHPGTIEDGRVFGWDLKTGQLLPGWTNGVSTGPSVNGESGVYGALTSGVLEGNGMPDIVATSFSSNVTAIRLDGSVMWQWTDNDTIISGAVIGDIDRSGTPSVILGGDSSNSPYFQSGGWVNVLSNTGILKWRHFIPGETTWSTPTLADLNNNGYLDIVIGTGENYDFANAPGARALGNNIYAFDPFGNILPGWPYHTTNNDSQPHEVLQSLAVADLTGNGQLDVIAIDRSAYLHVIQPNGQDLPGFAGGKPIAPDLPATSIPDDYASPIVADVTGSGRPEIIAAAGPFLRAFDVFGNMVWSITTDNVGGLPEGIDSAPVVGNMDGGPNLTLGLVTYNTTNSNRPDEVRVYLLPQTTVVPPWPSERKTASGVGVVRSTSFDQNFVALAFRGAIGGLPDAATVQAFDNVLDTNTLDLFSTAYYIFTGPLARQAEVTRVYQSLLGHAPDANAISGWSNYLVNNTVENMELLLIGGPEFAGVSGNTLAGEVTHLYQAILNRTPSQSEVNAWVATKESPVTIAGSFFNGNEGLTDTLNTMFSSIFGAGTQAYIPADTRAAFAYDYHRGANEGVIMAHLLANNGNYAASNFQADYTRDLFRDILHRDGSPGEIASWVQLLDSGAINVTQEPGFLLNSTEARSDFIQQEFQSLLGRAADPGTVNALVNYSSRESVILFIMGSSEYYAHSGGTDTSYIQAVSNELAGINPVPQSLINQYTSAFNSGTPRIKLAQDLMANPSLYFNYQAVNWIMQYLPDESQGVLRTGTLPPNAAGQPINPSPSLIASLTNLHNQGQPDEQIISSLLTSANYANRTTYYKGIYRSLGIRN